MEYEYSELANEQEIRELAEQYYHLVDEKRFGEMFTLFDDDILYERGTKVVLRGLPALIGYYTGGKKEDRQIASGAHAITNIVSHYPYIDIEGNFSGKLFDQTQVDVKFLDHFELRGKKFIKRKTEFLGDIEI